MPLLFPFLYSPLSPLLFLPNPTVSSLCESVALLCTSVRQPHLLYSPFLSSHFLCPPSSELFFPPLPVYSPGCPFTTVLVSEKIFTPVRYQCFTFGVFFSGNHVIFQCKHSEVQWAILKRTCPLRHCVNQIRYFHYHNLSSSNQQYSALGVSVLIQTWPCIYELIFEYHKTFFFFFTIFESNKVMVILSFLFPL